MLKTRYWHTCDCLPKDQEGQWLKELPKESYCLNPKYYVVYKNGKMEDVTNRVEVLT